LLLPGRLGNYLFAAALVGSRLDSNKVGKGTASRAAATTDSTVTGWVITILSCSGDDWENEGGSYDFFGECYTIGNSVTQTENCSGALLHKSIGV